VQAAAAQRLSTFMGCHQSSAPQVQLEILLVVIVGLRSDSLSRVCSASLPSTRPRVPLAAPCIRAAKLARSWGIQSSDVVVLERGTDVVCPLPMGGADGRG
jgi:hypothetical protein